MKVDAAGRKSAELPRVLPSAVILNDVLDHLEGLERGPHPSRDVDLAIGAVRNALASIEGKPGRASSRAPTSRTRAGQPAQRRRARPPGDLSRRLELAQSYLKRNDPERALPILEALLEMYPDTPEAEQARALLRELRSSEAAADSETE